MLFCTTAHADNLILPGNVLCIESEAFSDCQTINEIYLPDSIQTVAPDSFKGNAETLWVHCPQGEVAYSLLQSGFDVDSDTVYRALIIGQSYAGTEMALQGPANDARALRFCLASLGRLQYQIAQRTNLDADGILEAISDVFSNATEYDISLVYYSGHGREGGSLVGSDGVLLSPQALRSELDKIPGRKVIIIDACFSGGILEMQSNNLLADANSREADQHNQEETENSIRLFNSNFLDAFSPKMLRGSPEEGYSQYYIMTSARFDEYSEEGLIYSGTMSRIMGYFSYFLCQGCGWDGVQNTTAEHYADTNQDGAVSFEEAFSYAAMEARSYNINQDAQTNIVNCQSFSPFRYELEIEES